MTHLSPYFILASGSPRRREFMQLLGLPFTVITPAQATGADVDESPLPGESPAALVQRLSRIKAEVVATNLSKSNLKFDLPADYAVIAADTVVVLGGKILGKPQHPAEATQMLKDLRNRPHEVYSGVTVILARDDVGASGRTPLPTVTRLHRSTVWMRPYTDAEIAAYVAGGDPLDKAGAYGIQHQAFNPVARLAGCFASVMGLPLGELAAAMSELGIALPDVSPLCAGFTGQVCCLTKH